MTSGCTTEEAAERLSSNNNMTIPFRLGGFKSLRIKTVGNKKQKKKPTDVLLCVLLRISTHTVTVLHIISLTFKTEKINVASQWHYEFMSRSRPITHRPISCHFLYQKKMSKLKCNTVLSYISYLRWPGTTTCLCYLCNWGNYKVKQRLISVCESHDTTK